MINIFLFPCLLLISVLLIYWDVGTFEFINFDDDIYVTGNFNIKGGLTWDSVTWAFRSTYASNWHPLTWLSHIVDIELFGLEAGGHHVSNMLFHLLNTLLLFFVLKKMTLSSYKSFFVALLFAIHPINIESVAWVSERKNVLSSFFCMLTLGIYCSYAKKTSVLKYLTLLLFFLLGLLAKPMLVTLPFVLLLFDYWPLSRIREGWGQHRDSDQLVMEKRSILQLLLEKTPLFFLSFASCIMTYYAQKHGGAVESFEHLPIMSRMSNAVVQYGAYVKNLFYPLNLSIFYPYRRVISVVLLIGSGVSLIFVTLFVLKKAKEHPYLPVGWALYLGMLVPVIGIVQVGTQSMADRYMYLPGIGIFIIFVWGIHDLMKRGNIPFLFISPFVGMILFFFLTTSMNQVQVWANSISVFGHAITVDSENHLAHNNLGTTLRNLGQEEEALFHFKETIRIKPDYAEGHVNYGNYFFRHDQYDEAIRHYKEAIKVQPGKKTGYLAMTAVLLRQEKTAEATKYINWILNVDPEHSKALYYLGLILYQEEKFLESQSVFFRLVQVNPLHSSGHLHLGFISGILKNFSVAHDHFEKARQLGLPVLNDRSLDLGSFFSAMGRNSEALGYYLYVIENLSSSAYTLLNFASLLSQMGNQEGAFAQYTKALNLEPENSAVHKAVGVFYSRLKDFEKAIPYFKKSLQLAPDSAEPHYNLGYAFFKTGDSQGALTQYRQAVLMNPDYKSRPYE